jgi:hypothetical protein
MINLLSSCAFSFNVRRYIMERARRLDQGYLSAVGISMAPAIFGMQPAPTGALVPGVPRKAVLSGWACQTLLAASSYVIVLKKRGFKMRWNENYLRKNISRPYSQAALPTARAMRWTVPVRSGRSCRSVHTASDSVGRCRFTL